MAAVAEQHAGHFGPRPGRARRRSGHRDLRPRFLGDGSNAGAAPDCGAGRGYCFLQRVLVQARGDLRHTAGQHERHAAAA